MAKFASPDPAGHDHNPQQPSTRAGHGNVVADHPAPLHDPQEGGHHG